MHNQFFTRREIIVETALFRPRMGIPVRNSGVSWTLASCKLITPTFLRKMYIVIELRKFICASSFPPIIPNSGLLPASTSKRPVLCNTSFIPDVRQPPVEFYVQVSGTFNQSLSQFVRIPEAMPEILLNFFLLWELRETSSFKTGQISWHRLTSKPSILLLALVNGLSGAKTSGSIGWRFCP